MRYLEHWGMILKITNNQGIKKPMTKTSGYAAKPLQACKYRLANRLHHLLCLAAAVSIWSVSANAQSDASDGASPALSATATAAPLVPPQETLDDSDVAQTGTAPGRTVKPTPVAPSGKPFQLGAFLIYPEIDATWTYDSNLYSSNTAPLGDHAWIYSPALWVQSNWARHALNFHAGADLTRYDTYGTENSDDQNISAEGRYDFSADTNVYGGAYFAREHEDRESPSARNGLTPTEYFQRRYYGGFFRQFDRLSLRIAGTAQHLNYKDVNFITGGGALSIINNDDRDRWQYTGGFRLGYEITPRLEPYLQVAFDNRRYDIKVDDLDYSRDSQGQRYLAGLRWNAPRQIKLDAFVGWLLQDYNDPRLKDISDAVAGVAVQWAATDKTTVSAHLDRTVEETTVTLTPSPGLVLVSSSFLNTYGSAGVEHRFNNKLSARLNGSVSHVAYQGIPRTDDYYGATIGATYRIHRNLFLDLSYTDRKLSSSIPTEDFSKHLLFARIAIPFSH